MALGLSFVVTPVTVLLLTYQPGPLTATQLLVAMVFLSSVPAVVSALLRRRQEKNLTAGPFPAEETATTQSEQTRPRWRLALIWLGLALLLAMGLRFINLGYSEFQGDEAIIMVRTARILEGVDQVVFEAKKAPAQFTIVMANWRLAGISNELMARFPFAWLSMLGLAGVYLVSRRLKDQWLGILAVSLLAIEGYLVAFARITQYQSLVFALSVLALLCLLVYHRSGYGALVVLAAALFAGGFLAHYDAALVLPAGLFLIGARFWQERRFNARTLLPLVVAALIGLFLIALFYIPFYRSPWVDYTSDYIATRVGGTLSNNLRETFILSTVYNSIYYILLLIGGLVFALFQTWSSWGKRGQVFVGLLFLLAATTVIWSESWMFRSVTLAGLPFLILLAGAIVAPRQSDGMRALWIWFSVPFLFYLFVAAVPWTHVHTFFIPWAILVAWSLIKAWRWLGIHSRQMRAVALGLFALLYFLFAFYIVMMFVDHTPEYRRTFPENQSALYPTLYDRIPNFGIFGFPYQAGWKVVGYLRDSNQLPGNFDSNEEPPITDYYTRHAQRQPSPDMYVTAVNVQDQIAINWDLVESEYSPVLVSTVGGEPKLTVHLQGVSGDNLIFPVEDYEHLFDQSTTPARVANLSGRLKQGMSDTYAPQDLIFGDFAHLIGYHLESDLAIPGGYVSLTLIWEALDKTTVDYHVFNHLHDGSAMRGQTDGKPASGARPTTTWQPGEQIIDTYRIPILADSPAGSVPLRIGMYDLATMTRAEIRTGGGEAIGDSIHLTDVVIQSP